MVRRLQLRILTKSNLVLSLLGAGFLLLTILSGVGAKDYPLYLVEWSRILDGQDPWQRPLAGEMFAYNAYGPLFNLIAPLTLVHPLAPKLLFSFVYIVYAGWLALRLAPSRGIPVFSPQILFILFNPLPWVEIAGNGVFDGLVGIACLASVHALLRGREKSSAIWLGAGILLKYIPLAVLPLLAFDAARIRVRFLLWCAGFILLGLGVSALTWGVSIFSPLAFALTRDTSTSMYDFLGYGPELLKRIGIPVPFRWTVADVSWLATPCMILTSGMTFAWCAIKRISAHCSAVMILLAVTLFYRVGFLQYQLVLFCCASYWAVLEWPAIEEDAALKNLLIFYFALVGIMATTNETHLFGYYATLGRDGRMAFGGYYFLSILLRFVSGVALVGLLMRMASRSKDAKRWRPWPSRGNTLTRPALSQRLEPTFFMIFRPSGPLDRNSGSLTPPGGGTMRLD